MLIVITGPIASGKSTLARALAAELERAHGRVAVIDLDVVYDMLTTGRATSSDDTWTLARHAAATLANGFLEGGVALVIAEGSFNRPGDRAAFADHLDASVSPTYVRLEVSYEEALRRAQRDPTRGKSRDPDFLGSYFAAAADRGLAMAPTTDLVIDTERSSVTAAAVEIARLLRSQT